MVPEHTPARANPARGLALIASAVIVGIFVLRQGWDNTSGVSASTGSGAEQSGEAPEGGGTTTVATAPERQPGEVTVRVFNATDTGGAAARLSDEIAQEGWKTVDPTDAPEGWQSEKTEVFFTPGFDREAATVAGAIAAPSDAVKALPEPPEMDPAGANVLVMLGGDLAPAYAD